MSDEILKTINDRELMVLALVARGYNSQQIGDALSITKATVQTHRRKMLRKKGFINTQQMVGWGYREGLLR